MYVYLGTCLGKYLDAENPTPLPGRWVTTGWDIWRISHVSLVALRRLRCEYLQVTRSVAFGSCCRVELPKHSLLEYLLGTVLPILEYEYSLYKSHGIERAVFMFSPTTTGSREKLLEVEWHLVVEGSSTWQTRYLCTVGRRQLTCTHLSRPGRGADKSLILDACSRGICIIGDSSCTYTSFSLGRDAFWCGTRSDDQRCWLPDWTSHQYVP